MCNTIVNNHLSLCLTSELRLKQALLDVGVENPASVSQLTVAGMLTEDDVRFIRENMRETLEKLDMGDAVFEENILPHCAFEFCTGLNFVVIPDSVNVIGSYVFYGCTGLISVSIGNNVNVIGSYVFYGCTGLISITIGSNVNTIGSYGFYGCTSLTSVHIPAGVATIGDTSFYGCSKLTAIEVAEGNAVYSSADGVLFDKSKKKLITCPAGKQGAYTIPAGVTVIWESAFEGCAELTSIVIPAGVANIDFAVFCGCSKLAAIEVAEGNAAYSSADGVLFDKSKKKLMTCPAGKQGAYTIPAGVSVIWESAFEGCAELTSIVIPDGVTSIGSEAFYECTGLTSITIPAGVIAIGKHAFGKCSNLADIVAVAGNSKDGALLSKTGKTLITCPEGKQGTFTIPDGVTAIGEKAFEGCAKLTSVYIPVSVVKIAEDSFEKCKAFVEVHHNNIVYKSACNEWIKNYLASKNKKMTNFAAIVFKIANHHNSSVCSVGVVIVREGQIVEKIYRLIRPEPEWYWWRFTQIHGLTADDTADEKPFPKVWKDIAPKIEGLPLVAHNSLFDEGCLHDVFHVYQMDYPDYEFHCTCAASRRKFGDELTSHSLSYVAAHCGYDFRNHHHALADAEACAAIAMMVL